MSEHLLSNTAAVPPEEIAAEEARLAIAPLQPRAAAALVALGKVQVADDEDMRRAMDKIAISRAVREETDRRLEPIGKPYRDSSHAVRMVAVGFADPLKAAEIEVQARISAYRQRQREAAARARDEQNAREAELRKQAGLVVDPGMVAPVRPADIRLGPQRSDYRAQAFDRKIVLVKIVDPRILPDTVLKSPGVIEAMEKAVRKLASLTRDIPGAEVTDDQTTNVKVK